MKSAEELLGYCVRAVGSADPAARTALIDGILSRRKIFVYGSGRSGLVGQMFAVRLVQLGLDVHFVGEMTTPIIGREDLTVLISYTGKTSSVVQTAEIAGRIGSEVVCVTGTRDSPLTRASDVSVVMDIPPGDELSRIAPLGTVFEDSAIILFDGIVSEIMERENISEDDMRRRHAIWVRSSVERIRKNFHDVSVGNAFGNRGVGAEKPVSVSEYGTSVASPHFSGQVAYSRNFVFGTQIHAHTQVRFSVRQRESDHFPHLLEALPKHSASTI